MQQVAEGITANLIRRHPHVFAEVTVSDAEEVKANWQTIKAQEKGLNPDQTPLLSIKLERYNSTLPPLMAGSKISQKAAAVGFEWPDVDGVWAKFTEELTEFKQALTTEDKGHQQAELGDLLFTLINLARWYNLDASLALHGTNQRFIQRLQLMEKFADRPLDQYKLEELETLWQQAKKQLNQ